MMRQTTIYPGTTAIVPESLHATTINPYFKKPIAKNVLDKMMKWNKYHRMETKELLDAGFEKGIMARTAQEIMGHSNYKTIVSYTHCLEDVKQKE
jgi:hypothetical protein